MKVKLSEDFKCAPDGHTVHHLKKGDVVEGSVAECVLRHKKGDELGKEEPKKKSPKPKAKKPAKPKVAKQPKPDHEG